MPKSRYPNGTGIYAFKNLINTRRYVGQGAFKSRWPSHLRLLHRGEHFNKALQADWDSYGESAFVFEILELVTDDRSLSALERRYILETTDSYNADAVTSIIRGPCSGRGVQALAVKRGMAISDLWNALMQAGANLDYQTVRRYWYGSRNGSRTGDAMHLFSLDVMEVISRVLELPVATVIQHIADGI